MAADWMIYGRERGSGKKFRAFDGEGFTGNLMLALRFPPEDTERVRGFVDELNGKNPGYEFEMRRGTGSIYSGSEWKKGRTAAGKKKVVYRDAPLKTDEGDVAIYGRQFGIGRYRPFDGSALADGEPLRWPNCYHGLVMEMVDALNRNNPALEFQTAIMPDTVFESYPPMDEGSSLSHPEIMDMTVRTPYMGSFSEPPVESPGGYGIDYSTQVFGSEIVTEPVSGRRTPANKARTLDSAITELSGGNVTMLRSSIVNSVYYGVLEACNPDLGSCQRILVTGKVLDAPNGGVQTYLLQSDTGSPFLDCPKSYLSMLDEPRTSEDEGYRTKVVERNAGDGRPWDERRYTVNGNATDADGMVSAVSEATGLTPWQVSTTRDIRALRVHDTYDAKGARIVRCYNPKKGILGRFRR